MMERTLLDTDIFSEVLKRKHQHVVAVAHAYYQQFGYYTTSTITVTENLLLATGNTKHYERIQQLGYDLRLTNWRTEPLNIVEQTDDNN